MLIVGENEQEERNFLVAKVHGKVMSRNFLFRRPFIAYVKWIYTLRY